MKNASQVLKGILAVGLASAISACGGGSDDGGLLGGGDDDRDDLLTWQEGVFLDQAVYKDFCEAPRTGTDPFNNDQPYPDRAGSTLEENFYLRSWTNDLYLWYSEVPDLDPGLFSTDDYFDQLKTTELSATGNLKDNFHFSQDTFDYLNSTVAGVSFGYGYRLAVGSTTPPREFRIADVVPGSPADLAGVQRGMLITAIDGADMINGNDVDTLNAGLFPSTVGENHQFSLQAYGETESVNFNLVSASIDSVPVKGTSVISTATGNVGYIHFNSHISPAESALFDAFTTLEAEGVTDLVLDLRYNGGGLLAIASEVAYMVAGSSPTSNNTFYALQFNDKYPTTNPVTGSSLSPMPFFSSSLGFAPELLGVSSLPTLNLSRVFVLTTDGTCSASEAIINGLRGINIDVIQIGTTTCGKPYGFYPQDNCGTTYFTVQFAGVNDLGFGEYADGFSPANTPVNPGVPVQGCWVEDDYSAQLGDVQEAQLAAALQYREDGTCPPVSAQKPSFNTTLQKSGGLSIELKQNEALNNAIMTR